MSNLKQQAELVLVRRGAMGYVAFILDTARERIGKDDLRVQMLAGHMWDAYIAINDNDEQTEKALRHKTMQEAHELLEDMINMEV